MFKFLFVSANYGGGGSEELWVQSAGVLIQQGHQVAALTQWHEGVVGRREQLTGAGVIHYSLEKAHPTILKAARKLFRMVPRNLGLLRCQIQKFRPDLVIFNSGTLLDGLALLEVINAERIPYVVVTHLVSTDNWPDDHQAMCIQETYSGAIETNFVSEHNRHLFFMQTGCVLANSSIVRNPFLVHNSRCPMPSIDNSRFIRLALPARLHPRTKGQDVLFEVLSRKHWRESQIRVSLFGTGGCERSLKDVCNKMNLNEMVTFAGHVDDMNAVWETHHGLILPSRHEGLPIALIEAMWAGRVVIATPAGGIPEMIIPEKTGFLATACHADALDIALREAWSNLSKWQEMGDEAHRFIRNQIPHDPAISWAEHLTSLVEQSKKASTS